MSNHIPLKDVGLILFVFVAWGTAFPSSKLMFEELSPMLSLSIRTGLALIIFSFFVRKLPQKQMLKYLLPFIITQYALHQSLNWIALQYVDVSNIALIQQSGTLFSVLIGVLILKEAISIQTMIGMLISIIGLFIVFGAPTLHGEGLYVGFLIVSSFFGAVSTLFLKKMGKIDVPSLFFYPYLGALPIYIGLSLTLETNHIQQIMEADWIKLSFLFAYHLTVLNYAFIIWQRVLERNDMTKVTMYLVLYPVFAVFFGIVLLNEPITQNLVIGGLLTLLGGVFLTWRFRKKDHKIEITDPDDMAEIYVDKTP
jgi:O-acetylserine/cysteine efflux transporter